MKSSLVSRSTRRSTALAIAIADDVPEIQALAREWLTAAGHGVICVSDGQELVRLTRDQPFDLVITDVVMPEADGFEVIAEMKRSNPNVRIVAMSGGGTVMPATDCLRVAARLGADAVLSKPFSRDQLMRAIAEAMGAHRAAV